MVAETLASRFMALLEGAKNSHGTYSEEDPEPGGKRTIKRTARTLREPVTEELWAFHLAGSRPLGVVPIMEDNCCMWGAVDIDVYTLDIPDLVKMLREASIPAIVCRTKSGGAHVYLFFSEPIPAELVVPRLRELAAFVGHGSSEIFPKQTTVLSDRGDLGSWLNMPYFGGDTTVRYAVNVNGQGLSTERFLSSAEASRLSRRGLADLVLTRAAEGFEAGPPCLESLVSTGFPPHTRNNGVLALGVLAKKMYPTDWARRLTEWVAKYGGDPPFPRDELKGIIKNLEKKEYNYRCNDTPLNMRCNVAVCKNRPHGVGNGAGASVLETIHILRTDPPVFFALLKTPAVTVELSATQLLNPHEFQLCVLVQHSQIVPEYKRQDWMNWVRLAMENAVSVEAPRDSGQKGQFEEILEQFVTDRHAASSREELLMGKPWHDEERGLVHFRLKDLDDMMKREKFSVPNGGRSWITARLRDMGGENIQFNAKGKNVSAWCLPSKLFSWTTGPVSLPDRGESPL